jgi:hypothetical protein
MNRPEHDLRCTQHKISLVIFCPACRGSRSSERKASASRENGKLGGRPRKGARLGQSGEGVK